MANSSPADFYDALAEFYHLNYANWGESIARQAGALDTILRERDIEPPAHILDAACGIGTQALGLARLGYRVTGSDISERAVSRGRAEAAERGLMIDFSAADMREGDRHHGRAFDVVIACTPMGRRRLLCLSTLPTSRDPPDNRHILPFTSSAFIDSLLSLPYPSQQPESRPKGRLDLLSLLLSGAGLPAWLGG